MEPTPPSTLKSLDKSILALLTRLEKETANLDLHQQLRDVALRRATAGGKPAGGFLGPTLPYAGKTDKEKMLNAEYVLSHDPANIPAMMDLYRAAESAGYSDVADWIGQILKAAAKASRP